MDLRHDKRPICEASCAVKVMEISVETEDAVNPKVPHMGTQCHPYFLCPESVNLLAVQSFVS